MILLFIKFLRFFASGQIYLGKSYAAEYSDVTVFDRALTRDEFVRANGRLFTPDGPVQGWWNYRLTLGTFRLEEELSANIFSKYIRHW